MAEDADPDIDSVVLNHPRQLDVAALTPGSQEADLPDEDDDGDDLLEQQLNEEIRLLDTRPPIKTLHPLPSDKNFYEVLDEFVPTIPEDVTTYFLNCAGFNNPNPRLKKVVSLAVQRFVSDISNDAVNYARFTAQSTVNTNRIARREPKLMLSMDDLTQSLKDYGIIIAKPDYWAETPQPKVPVEKKDKPKTGKEKRKKPDASVASPAPKEAKIEKVATMAPAASKDSGKKDKKRSHKASKGDKAY